MIKQNKTQSIKQGLYSIMYDNGRTEVRVMTNQQRKALARSKAWKKILSCECICRLEITIKLKF